MKRLLVPAAILTTALLAYAHTDYTGYSGAPSSFGTCAYSCHGTIGGGTIQITGFPAEYVPLQSYEVTIFHTGGAQISQFNGSCRAGFSSQNAGVISAGTRTETYNVPVESNGVHFSTAYQDTATFNWTAPHQGTGEVRLYVAGQQDHMSGPNTILVLTANEQHTNVEESATASSAQFALQSAYPNPFNASTVLTYAVALESPVKLTIHDIFGNQVATLLEGVQSPGQHRVIWDASRAASGIYFCQMSAPGFQSVRKIVLIK